MRIEMLGPIRNAQAIVSGRGVRIRAMLKAKFGGGHWRKMKGIATIRDQYGKVYEAEIHWYEAHGIGKRLVKFKRAII